MDLHNDSPLPESTLESTRLENGQHPATLTLRTDEDARDGSDIGARLAAQQESPALLDSGRITWIQVLASFLINMNVYGLVNAFGDFQHLYETEYLKRLSCANLGKKKK